MANNRRINPQLEADVAYLQGLVKSACSRNPAQLSDPLQRKIAEVSRRDASNAYDIGFINRAREFGLNEQDVKVAYAINAKRMAQQG